jgi:hypothetical protein
MSIIQVYVNLKIPDNIERTALYACRSSLGFDSLESLSRTEFWELDFPGLTEDEALPTAERLVEKTSLFANPNKHRWYLDAVDRLLENNGVLTVPSSASALILVCDREDGKAESTLEAIHRFDDNNAQLASLLRGVLWQVTFSGTDQQKIREQVEKLAVTESRSQGLLVNPHYQSHRIFY